MRPQMGNRGRSWTGLIAFLALAILMAALGPSELPSSPVADVVDAGALAPSRAASVAVFVASR